MTTNSCELSYCSWFRFSTKGSIRCVKHAACNEACFSFHAHSFWSCLSAIAAPLTFRTHGWLHSDSTGFPSVLVLHVKRSCRAFASKSTRWTHRQNSRTSRLMVGNNQSIKRDRRPKRIVGLARLVVQLTVIFNQCVSFSPRPYHSPTT